VVVGHCARPGGRGKMKEFGFFLGGCARENPGDWYPLRGSDGKSGQRRDTGRTRELMHAAAHFGWPGYLPQRRRPCAGATRRQSEAGPRHPEMRQAGGRARSGSPPAV
jgi:hypothetical protein